MVLSGCDSASVYEDCAKEEKAGTGEERCVPSTFPQEHARAREAAGFVSVGSVRVPNALVVVNGVATTTDTGGIYRHTDTPFRYDVAARVDNEVIAMQAVGQRFMDLAVERDGPLKGFPASVSLVVTNAPRPAHRLAFFVGGENVVGVSGTLADGLIVSSRTFENDKVKLHVVEYPESGGLANAVAKGSLELRVRSGTTTPASLTLDPVAERKKVTLRTPTDGPAGMTYDDLEIFLRIGTREGRVSVLRAKLDEAFELPVMPDAEWFAGARGTRADGASTAIKLRPFAPGDAFPLLFYEPPTAARNEGHVLFADNAKKPGVFEHVLTPVAGTGGGATIHVFSASEDARVPDLTPLGLPPARGEYRWTVRVFNDFAFVEAMSGVDARLFWAHGTSAPRTITLP